MSDIKKVLGPLIKGKRYKIRRSLRFTDTAWRMAPLPPSMFGPLLTNRYAQRWH